MPSFDRGSLAEILDHIVRRLRAKIPELPDRACYISDQPTPVAWPTGPLCATVSVSRAAFPAPFQAGGGASTLSCESTVDVTCWVRSTLDQLAASDVVLLGVDRGVWERLVPAVLRAMLLETDASGGVAAWNPLGTDGYGLLRNQIAAQSITPPRPDETGEWVGTTASFSIDFDWRL